MSQRSDPRNDPPSDGGRPGPGGLGHVPPAGRLETGSDLFADARREGGAVIASVRGEIDLHHSAELREALLGVLLRDTPAKLVLNLAAVPYMDSSALAVLVEGMQRMRRHGGKIYLTHLHPRVRGLLEIARLDTIFVVARDEADALAR